MEESDFLSKYLSLYVYSGSMEFHLKGFTIKHSYWKLFLNPTPLNKGTRGKAVSPKSGGGE